MSWKLYLFASDSFGVSSATEMREENLMSKIICCPLLYIIKMETIVILLLLQHTVIVGMCNYGLVNDFEISVKWKYRNENKLKYINISRKLYLFVTDSLGVNFATNLSKEIDCQKELVPLLYFIRLDTIFILHSYNRHPLLAWAISALPKILK